MRKFRLVHKDFAGVANKEVVPSIHTREITCLDLFLDNVYIGFFGDNLPEVSSCGGRPNLSINRLLLLIPRENLISLEEIF